MQLDVAPLPASPVPRTVLDEALTLTGAVAALAERFPDYECLSILHRDFTESRHSVGQIWRRAREIQSALQRHGMRPGSFVVVAIPTSAELVSAYFGVMLAGGVPALVATPSHRLAEGGAYAARVAAIADNAQAYAVYAADDVADMLREFRALLPAPTAILTRAEIPPAATLEPTRAADPDRLATVQYSSGSTGPPKGVLLTHRAVLNNVRALRTGLGLRTSDIAVNWIPLYHDMGLVDAFLLPLLSGCPTVLIPTLDFMRDPALWLWAIHHYRGAHAWAPNFAYALCVKRIPDVELAGLDLSTWRIAVSAAEPILAPTVAAFLRRFAAYGFKPEAFSPVYGLAENVTAATAQSPSEAPLFETIDRDVLVREDRALPTGTGIELVATGRALPGCEIEIRDAEERPLPERSVGTIWLRTDCLCAGYHRDPEATARALVQGWLNTGDRGYLAAGHLYFVSREKDLLVIGGEKYAPQEIEAAINRVPGVREGCAAVFGILNEERGTEDIAAVIETKETAEDLLAALRDAIQHEVIRATGLALRYVILVPPGGVQKTTSGKLARGATRERYRAQLGAES